VRCNESACRASAIAPMALEPKRSARKAERAPLTRAYVHLMRRVANCVRKKHGVTVEHSQNLPASSVGNDTRMGQLILPGGVRGLEKARNFSKGLTQIDFAGPMVWHGKAIAQRVESPARPTVTGLHDRHGGA